MGRVRDRKPASSRASEDTQQLLPRHRCGGRVAGWSDLDGRGQTQHRPDVDAPASGRCGLLGHDRGLSRVRGGRNVSDGRRRRGGRRGRVSPPSCQHGQLKPAPPVKRVRARRRWRRARGRRRCANCGETVQRPTVQQQRRRDAAAAPSRGSNTTWASRKQRRVSGTTPQYGLLGAEQ